MPGLKLIYQGRYSIKPQFFKLYQGNGENKSWWDLGHCVTCSGGIVCFLAVPEWEVSRLPPGSGLLHTWHLPRTEFLWCISFDSQETEKVMFIYRVACGGGGDVVQCMGLCERGEGDDEWLWPEHVWSACQGSGASILMLDVSSSPYGRHASIRHNLALVQSSDLVSVLFNPCSRSLMNLFNTTSPQLSTVPFIIIICLQSCSHFPIPVLCIGPSQVFLN